jgi:outer membrane protein assembly factor BamB
MKIKSCKIMKKISLILNIALLGTLGTLGTLHAQTIYQWRGPDRSGIYAETGLLKSWPQNGPELFWFTEELGNGFAAPVVTPDRLYINGENEGNSYLFAFDLKGKLLWKAPNGSEFKGSGYASSFPGARSTPTVAGDLVYSMSGKGRLACFETNTGKEKWAVELVKDLGGLDCEFGFAESPLIDGDLVFCTPGGPKNNIAALNRHTGKPVWTAKALGDTSSFVSPLLVSLPARKILVTMMRHYIIGVDVKNGELLWSQKLENYKYDGDHCNIPVFADGMIYYCTADENGNGMVKLELSPDGKSVRELWRNKDAANGFGGFVQSGNHLFLATAKKQLVALETGKGNVVSSLRPCSGSIIMADNRLFSYSDNGDMKLISFEGNKLSEISSFKVVKGTKEHFSHPVIDNGILYIRHGKALMAYRIK